MSEKLNVAIHVLLNLIIPITNRARRAVIHIIRLSRSSFFWRSIYAISLLFFWSWLASNFWTLLSFWKSSGYISTGIVILGVAGESISEFGNFSQDDEGHKRRRTIGKLSALVLIAGLAIELFCGVRTAELSDEVIADLQHESSATFRAAGSAIERASEALVEQEKLKSENLRLEALIQPRRLSNKQEDAISASLKKFPGKTVHVATYSLDVEAMVLAEQIIKALSGARINVIDGTATINSMSLPVYFGIIGNTGFPDQKLTLAIINSLERNGHLSAVMSDFKTGVGTTIYLPKSEKKPDAMIMIGVKPIATDK